MPDKLREVSVRFEGEPRRFVLSQSIEYNYSVQFPAGKTPQKLLTHICQNPLFRLLTQPILSHRLQGTCSC